jgi:hypothetical protein
MNYRNQTANANYGYNNQMQRNGMAGTQTQPYVPMGVSSIKENDDCCNIIAKEAGKDSLASMPLAMAYVPWQCFQNLYNCKEAFKHGTIFKELDLDFYGRRCNNYGK